MPQIVRTFSSDVGLQNRIEDLVLRAGDAGFVKQVLPELVCKISSPLIDHRGLVAEDYAYLYELMSVPPGALNSEAFNKTRAERFKSPTSAEDDALVRVIAQVIKARARRNLAHIAAPSMRVNYSRVVNVLLTLGLSAFEDRLREHQGSKAINAGKSQAQPAKSKARRSIAA